MGHVETALPSDQELPADGGFGFVQGDLQTCRGRDFRSTQTRRSAADDGNGRNCRGNEGIHQNHGLQLGRPRANSVRSALKFTTTIEATLSSLVKRLVDGPAFAPPGHHQCLSQRTELCSVLLNLDEFADVVRFRALKSNCDVYVSRCICSS